jgi:hypothetical protein
MPETIRLLNKTDLQETPIQAFKHTRIVICGSLLYFQQKIIIILIAYARCRRDEQYAIKQFDKNPHAASENMESNMNMFADNTIPRRYCHVQLNHASNTTYTNIIG